MTNDKWPTDWLHPFNGVIDNVLLVRCLSVRPSITIQYCVEITAHDNPAIFVTTVIRVTKFRRVNGGLKHRWDILQSYSPHSTKVW